MKYETQQGTFAYQIQKPAPRPSELEGPILGQHAPSSEHVNRRRNRVRNAERNDGRRSDGVERARGPEENAPEHDDPRGGPQQRIERHVELRVHLRKDAAERQPAIARKRVGHATAGGHERGGGEEHADEREHEEADAAGGALRGVHEDLQQRAGAGLDDAIDVADAEKHARQEHEPRAHPDRDARQHDARAAHLGVRDLLDHVRHRVEPRECERALQQAQQPRHAVRPPHLVDEVAVHERAALVVGRRAREHRDADHHEPAQAPEERGLGEERQQARREGVDEERDHRECDIDEELVPSFHLVVRVQ